jgi:hypothetical protein
MYYKNKNRHKKSGSLRKSGLRLNFVKNIGKMHKKNIRLLGCFGRIDSIAFPDTP